MATPNILVNRAPVLTLWGTVVAHCLGYDEDASLTLGKALAGLNAQTKGRMLGIYSKKEAPDGEPRKKAGLGEQFWIEICGRAIPAKQTESGIRAVVKDKPIEPEKVAGYLESKFGDDFPRVRAAMAELAGSFSADELRAVAYSLYEGFRPVIPRGKRGWGAKGELSLAVLQSLRPGGSHE